LSVAASACAEDAGDATPAGSSGSGAIMNAWDGDSLPGIGARRMLCSGRHL